MDFFRVRLRGREDRARVGPREIVDDYWEYVY